MALYGMGDFHLAFSVDKSMEVFDPIWKDHEKKIERNWRRYVKETDTAVLTGDHSWGRNLEECREDLEFIMGLPGRKILLRGNHDMFWDAKKTDRLNKQFQGRLEFLQNNFYAYGEYALVGTKGYCYEGKDSYEHFEKIRDRELQRLRISLEEAAAAGKNAAKYVQNNCTMGEAGKEIPIIATDGVRYTVPKTIHVNRMEDELVVRFRVGEK